MKMMNLIAISLVAASLLVSALLSPTPQTNTDNGGPQVIVTEGHRAVLVEYADTTSDGNTKVSISPSEEEHGKGKEALPTHEGVGHSGARELICDAVGKCKDKITGVWVRSKEKALETEGRAKEMAHKAEEKAEGVGEIAKEKVKHAGEAAKRKAVETAEKVKEKTGDMARETAEKVKSKTEDMAREAAEKVKSKTGEVVEETTEKIKETGKGKKELSDIARRAKEVVFDIFGYFLGSDSINSLMRMIQMMGFSMAYGMSAWVTFIMSYVLAGVLPRQQFGMVQSKIYPVYFKAMVASISLALLGHLIGHRGKLFKNKADMLQASNLLFSLLFVLVNLQILEPRATKVMFGRMKLEKEEGRGDHTRVNVDTVLSDPVGPVQTSTTTTSIAGRPEQEATKLKLAKLDDRLKKLNSYSSLLNTGTLMGLTWHLVYLSQRLAAN